MGKEPSAHCLGFRQGAGYSGWCEPAESSFGASPEAEGTRHAYHGAADSGHDRKSLGSAYRRDLCRRFFFRENQILSSFIYIYFVDVSTYIGVFC